MLSYLVMVTGDELSQIMRVGKGVGVGVWVVVVCFFSSELSSELFGSKLVKNCLHSSLITEVITVEPVLPHLSLICQPGIRGHEAPHHHHLSHQAHGHKQE